ncbi:sensor histidine kinase [Aurantimonas sp. Leaf443]|uniref:HAMP domain-containing sensor histidine kinase n=1 Tax=Aurantimonas sp. Leaf443 TaxID=1736378 RepID=UPI0009EAC9A1|nr:sensor histidine kinase [Aurantimonas sp. Leaf443]
MSLKLRLATTLAVTFCLLLAAGAFLALGQAQRRVSAELEAARSVASNRVAQALAELPASRQPVVDLEAFARSFNGDRHVQMMLIDSKGIVRAASQLAGDSGPIPDWFLTLVAPRSRTVVMPLTGRASPFVAAAVSIDPRNEVSEVWTDLALALLTVVASVLAGFVAVYLVAGRALRPLRDLEAAFSRIGAAGPALRLREAGPPEVRALARGFNAMAARLDDISVSNRRLSEHLLHLQDEERAELARDLHDDVGPLLFAVDVDASTIKRAALKAGEGETATRAGAIQANAHRARQELRRILGNLRPGLLPGLGLKAMVEDMAGTLAQRHPETQFVLDLADGDFGGPLETMVFRAIREAVSNALRHGEPRRVTIRVGPRGDVLRFAVTDDGGGLPESGTKGGFGLVGMAERLQAAGGRLTVEHVPLPPGVRVTGEAPLPGTARKGAGEEPAPEKNGQGPDGFAAEGTGREAAQ